MPSVIFMPALVRHLIAWTLAAALLPPVAVAATAVTPPSGGVTSSPSPSEPHLWATALQHLMPQPKPLMLRGANGQETLILPIARRLAIRRATLHLVAMNSSALLSRRSQLVLRLEDRIIAQIGLQGDLPQIHARIDLPPALLQPGYHRLTFAVAQHYTDDCEDPAAPELWTQIDTAQSWIELDGDLARWQPRLSEAGDIFDPKLWGRHRVTVLYGGTPTPMTLRWGALAAQGAALRLQYAPLAVEAMAPRVTAADPASGLPWRIDTRAIPGDALWVGTTAQLAPLMQPDWVAQIRGPFLALLPLDPSHTRFALVISGRTSDEVDIALRAWTLLNYPYPQTDSAVVRAVALPKLPDYPAPNQLYPNQATSFSQLGVPTTVFEGMYGNADLSFSLPPDLFAPDNAMVRLHLRFAYGSGLREDSVLNVLLNGQFQTAIPLSARTGGYFQNYEVLIPLTSFRPGLNTVRFEATMMPRVSGRCVALNTENLRLTLYDTSWIELPHAAHLTRLPDLELLQRTGFPYTRAPYGAQRAVLVTSSDDATMSAAWTVVAKLAQLQKVPLLNLQWYQRADMLLRRPQDVLVVGPATGLPPIIRDALPLRLGTLSIAPYPIAVRPAIVGEMGWLRRVTRWLGSKLSLTDTVPEQPQTVWMTQRGIGLGAQAALLQSQWPDHPRALTVFTAEHASTLKRQVHGLVTPELWTQLRGNVVLWQEKRLATQQAGSQYTVGQAGLTSRIGFVLSRHPMFWGVLVAVLVLALSALTLRLLMRFKHRRHARVHEAPDDHRHDPPNAA